MILALNAFTETSNATSVTKVRSASARLHAGTWRPLVSVITTLYYMLRLFFIVECGIARFLCAMRVFEVRASSSSPRLYLCAKFRFFRGLHCWASPWKKSHTQSLTHLTCLMPREQRTNIFYHHRHHHHHVHFRQRPEVSVHPNKNGERCLRTILTERIWQRWCMTVIGNESHVTAGSWSHRVKTLHCCDCAVRMHSAPLMCHNWARFLLFGAFRATYSRKKHEQDRSDGSEHLLERLHCRLVDIWPPKW